MNPFSRLARNLTILGLFVFICAAASADEKPLMKDFMGVNGHFTFKPELYRPLCRLARNYHNLDWDVKRPGGAITFPRCVNGVDWNAHVFGPWKTGGFETDVCVQFGSFGRGAEGFEALWKDREDWAQEYGFTLARYLGPSGEHKLCTSIEIGNEPGNEFNDALYQRLFKRMAAGIREGDPEMKIVTCTVQARDSDKYSKDLRETFASDEIKALFDVINLHVYATKPEGARAHPWERSYPEDPSIDYLKIVNEAIAWRDAEAPGKQIWITEFGWDACTPEAMKRRDGWFEKLNWSGESDERQARYIVRSFLCFSEYDVDRAYLYFYNDDDQPSVHAASGVTRHFEPKPSYWAMRHLYKTLGDYRFNRVVQKDDRGLHIYEYVNGSNGRRVWAVWNATGDEERETLVTGLPAPPETIERMPLRDGPAPEVEFTLEQDGSVRLPVTQSPAYLFIPAQTSTRVDG
ncbi:MAG: hypothetical protein GC154_05945 [bacterium]|nr:hypothetical protein [bacterium]